jgi:exonuclease III
MRIIAVNLQYGGGDRVPALAAAILNAAPNVVVVTEFNPTTRRGQELTNALAERLPHVACDAATPASYGVAVFTDCEPGPSDPLRVRADGHHRWIEALLPGGLRVVGLYVPDGGNAASRLRKTTFWGSMLTAAPEWAATRTLVIGDFNTGMHLVDHGGDKLACAGEFQVFSELRCDTP